VDTTLQDRNLWLWIIDRPISMDIHTKSVDMDMDMDGKFHIHGNPDLFTFMSGVALECG